MGKLLPDDLYVHCFALDTLEPLLHVYEGCGRAYLGEVEGANVIKIHRRSGKLSYLVYPEFEDDPHPALLRSIRVNLRMRQIDCNDYAQCANPPVLHRKDSFLNPRSSASCQVRPLDDSRREKWLARQSERDWDPGRVVPEVGRAGVLPEGAPACAEQRPAERGIGIVPKRANLAIFNLTLGRILPVPS